MKQSIESFDRRWCSIRASLEGKPYHYVSLGPGDGQKDAVILQDLRRDNARLCYVAVDMSTEMLRLGVHTLTRQLKLSRSRILPVQLDFSAQENVAELRRLLQGLFGEEAVLFSLLGNTMANFENDTGLLKMLVEQLLRPQDRLLLEVATTRQLDDTLAQEAAEEYAHSRTFCEFATSALMHYTDLRIDMENLFFAGHIEEERALVIKIIYQNRSGQDIRMTLPDRTSVSFLRDDKIHLCTSRKYAQHYLDLLVTESGVHKITSSHFDFGLQFGMDLLFLAASPEAAPQERIIAEEIWR
jgi:L-histidine Nalpha-methyltransferase